MYELKNQIDKPWQVNYIKESKDKKYDIYSYKLVQWWTRWWVKNKYEQQIWKWIEWTQFTDVNWNEIKKERFDAWETIYLRVPKTKTNKEKKENSNIPWKVEFLWDKKDKKNRSFKWYSYKFAQWWTIWWVMDKFESQLWKSTFYEKFCDKNGNPLKKEWFAKWETIYYKEPNTDIIDPTPEMTINEIMKMSDNDVKQLYKYFSWQNWNLYNQHQDKKWWYIIINGKKLYETRWSSEITENKPFINTDVAESSTNVYQISLWIKKWNKFQWIILDCTDINNEPKRGTFSLKDAFYRE